VLVRPGVLEPCDRRGREPTGIRAEQGCQRLLEPARGDALEVKPRMPRVENLEYGLLPAARVQEANVRRRG
jgi:hypothetical protein